MKSVVPPAVLAEVADKAAAAYSEAMQSTERSRTSTQDRWSAVVLCVRAELLACENVFDKPRRNKRHNLNLLDEAA